MGFLRQNLFLILLAAAVMVLGALMLVTDFSFSGSLDQELEKRVRLSTALGELTRPSMGGQSLVNEEVLAAEKQRVETVRDAAKKVLQDAIKWNRRNYSILQLTAGDQTIAAFPIDEQRYNALQLQFIFTPEYQKQLAELRKSLSPTVKATSEEIAAEITNAQKFLLQKREQEEMLRARELSGGAAPVPAREAAPAPDMRVMPPWPSLTPGVVAGGNVPADIDFQAKQLGADIARMKKAREGMVYVAPDSFDQVLEAGQVGDPKKFWSTQVNLWVTRDIVSAINETNRQALEEGGGEVRKPNVINAAVKRLVKIEIPREYFIGRALSPSSTGGPPTPPPPVGPGPPGFPGGPPGMPGGPGFPGMMPGAEPITGFIPGAEVGPPMATRQEGMGLTLRQTCQYYEVIQYSFAVVMPTRYLPNLEHNLMNQNYHTVLWVDVGEVPAADVYYYGTEAVSQVKIYGELLILTAWERGSGWDPQTQNWKDFPRLIPPEALSSWVPKEALRPEDSQALVPRR